MNRFHQINSLGEFNNKYWQNIAVILVIFFLASCSSRAGNKSTIALYGADIEKETQISQIIEKYGKYRDSWENEKEEKIYQYSYTKNSYDLVSWLPIINHFGWITSINIEVLLTFDKDGKLIAKDDFFGKAKSKNSLVCNPKLYSCVGKVSKI